LPEIITYKIDETTYRKTIAATNGAYFFTGSKAAEKYNCFMELNIRERSDRYKDVDDKLAELGLSARLSADMMSYNFFCDVDLWRICGWRLRVN
jgi:hypothetical protein